MRTGGELNRRSQDRLAVRALNRAGAWMGVAGMEESAWNGSDAGLE